ncbi:MAG: rRNA maturation RNase YbeY [bacterium]|nr:rRNA maturation RNase YbeY [bacterium]
MIEIQNRTKSAVNKTRLRKAGEFVLLKENRPDEHVSVALLGETEMKRLNKMYRDKEYAANVLSFPGVDGLGEVLLCPSVIRKSAKECGIVTEHEMTRMLVHGILHLLGYDHEESMANAKLMEKKEEYYMSFFV